MPTSSETKQFSNISATTAAFTLTGGRYAFRRKHRPRTVAAGAYVAHRVTRSFLKKIGSKGGVATR